ncbi:cupin domain-containing protein [Sphingomonas sp. IW22]|uniref:cupin domain-containing protein n=1 Tax=Sphingomonas sp. IW22 TaxID=3242489 RepID=UPI0035218552
MPKLDLDAIPQDNRTGYPPEYADVVQGRLYRRLAPVAGLSDFGASHVVLRPGAWSAHRHWHEGEDELVVMLAGEAVLVEEDGETILRPGDIAAFPKGVANGHVLQNRSEADCVYLAIGRPSDSDCHYPDIDPHLFDGTRFAHRDKTPFE